MYLDWIGNIFIIVGLWGIGNKSRNAFLFSAIGEVIYIIYAVLSGLYGLGFICMVFATIAIRNYQKWGDDEQS